MNQKQLLAKKDELAREDHLGELELHCTPTSRIRAIVVAWSLGIALVIFGIVALLLVITRQVQDLLSFLALPAILTLVAVCIWYVLDSLIQNRTSVYVYTNGLVFFSRRGGRVVHWEEIRKMGIHYDNEAHPVTIYAELNDDNKIWFPGSRSRDSASDEALEKFIKEKIQRAENSPR